MRLCGGSIRATAAIRGENLSAAGAKDLASAGKILEKNTDYVLLFHVLKTTQIFDKLTLGLTIRAMRCVLLRPPCHLIAGTIHGTYFAL